MFEQFGFINIFLSFVTVYLTIQSQIITTRWKYVEKSLLMCNQFLQFIRLMKITIACTRLGLISHPFVTVPDITDPIKIKLTRSQVKLASGVRVATSVRADLRYT